MLALEVGVSFINYIIITGGSKAKKMKLTVKGGAAVDPDSGTHKFPLLNESSVFFFHPLHFD